MQEIKVQRKYSFSGHESFQCRHLWLKKGYDYVSKGKSFNAEDAVVELGVGKNMVSSIRFWMKAFDLLTQSDELTEFAHKLLSDKGWDPYLEDEATVWLLHYHLIKKGSASIYTIIFNELRREKIEFTKENFVAFVKRRVEAEKLPAINEKTLLEDFSVLSKMYMRSDAQAKDKEDSFSGILSELGLVKSYNKGKEEFFIIENTERPEIPDAVILYSILDANNFDVSLNLNTIEQEYNSVGSVFALNRPGLLSKIESLTNRNSYLVFNDQAGIKELQFKKKPNSFKILEDYYAN